MKMEIFVLLLMLALASEPKENESENVAKYEERIGEKRAEDLIIVKIEEDEYTKENEQTSTFIGVIYDKKCENWHARRNENGKTVYNGYYKDEETAAHASDTLARKLMANGKRNLKLNFPNDDTEVYYEKIYSSIYIGVTYHKRDKLWSTQRWSKSEKKMIHNGGYKNEGTAARASDTLSRKLMAEGEQNLKLNFPDDKTDVYPKKKTSSRYIGVTYNARGANWVAQRWSKNKCTMVYNGYYKDEKTAARASDNLARKLMANANQNLKLNFPDEETEVKPKKYQRYKRKRSDHESLGCSHNK